VTNIGHQFFRTFLIGVGWLALNGVVKAAENWVKVASPQFTLYSSAKSTDALQVAEEFQQFINALGEVLIVDARRLPPLTIVMFSHPKEFRAFRPLRPDGKPWDVAGFFSRQEGWAVFGLGGSRLDQDVRRTVFHEGVHWYLSGSEYSCPAWLEEGLAEVFSTFVMAKNHREWGQPIPDHIATLRSLQLMPLERLLSVSHTDPLFNEMQRTSLFYAESWAFAHFLLFGEHNGERKLYNEYVRLFRSGIHPDDAFRNAFKKDYLTMDRELSRYIEGGRYFVGGRAAAPLGKSLTVTLVGDAEREIALARLALGANSVPLAQIHLDKATGSDVDPVAFNEVEGYAALMNKDDVEALRFFTKAAAAGSKDYRVYFELAQRKHQAAADSGDSITLSPAEAREVADNYEKTIELCPWLLPPYQGLGGIIGLLGKDGEKDRSILQRGKEKFPADGMIQLGLAASLHESGQGKEAGEALSVILTDPGKYPPNVSRYARGLDRNWTFNDDNERIRILVESERFPEALKEIDVLLTKDVPQASRAMLALNRATIWVQVQLILAVRAGDEGRWTDARKTLEEIMAASVPNGTKYEAKMRLNEMNRRNLGRD